MILSKKFKFLFFKPRKTAGTSLEIALRFFCDENDLVTGISRVDEIISHKLNGLKQRPNVWHRYIRKLFGLTIFDKPKNIKFLSTRFENHTYQNQFFDNLLDFEKKNILENYYKISMVRNPYDQMRSFYQFRIARKKVDKVKGELNFVNFLKSYCNDFYNLEKKILFYNNKFILDKVIKYENLNEDLHYIESRLKLKDLTKIFGDINAKGGLYQKNLSLLNDEAKEIIYESSRFIFEKFNYKK